MAQHKSGGLTSQHDIEIFRAWKRTFPSYAWSRAEVNRDGLTLIDVSPAIGRETLHFPNAICGFNGTGPQATVTILHEAGFGDVETLSREVFANKEAVFTRE